MKSPIEVCSYIPPPNLQVWAWGGVVVLSSLSALNLFWFSKLVKMGGKMIAEYTPLPEIPATARPGQQERASVVPAKGKAGGGVGIPVFEIQVSAGGAAGPPPLLGASGGAAVGGGVGGTREGPAEAASMAASLTSGTRLWFHDNCNHQMGL